MYYYQRFGHRPRRAVRGRRLGRRHERRAGRDVHPLHGRVPGYQRDEGRARRLVRCGRPEPLHELGRDRRHPAPARLRADAQRLYRRLQHPRVGQRRPRPPRRGEVGARLAARACRTADGSVLSIVGPRRGEPAVDRHLALLYGSVSTSAAYSSAAAFAYASVVFKTRRSRRTRPSSLTAAAERVDLGRRPTPTSSSTTRPTSIGAGDSELDTAYGSRCAASRRRFISSPHRQPRRTRRYVEANYQNAHMFAYGNFADLFEGEAQEMLLDYTQVTGATPPSSRRSRARTQAGMQSSTQLRQPECRRPPIPTRRHVRLRVGEQPEQGAARDHVPGRGHLRHRRLRRAPTADRYAERYVHPFHGRQPALARLSVEHERTYGADEIGDALLPHVVQQQQRALERRGRVDVWAASGLPPGRAQSGVQLGQLLPRQLLGH